MRLSSKDRARFAAWSTPFKVVNGRKFRLRDYDPRDTLHLESSDKPRAQGHPAHEDPEHEGLRVGRMPQEELEVVAPDRLVDEARETRQGEEGEERAGGRGTGHGRPSLQCG